MDHLRGGVRPPFAMRLARMPNGRRLIGAAASLALLAALPGCAQAPVPWPREITEMQMSAAVGHDPHEARDRLGPVDDRGWNCNDYAWDAAAAHHARIAIVAVPVNGPDHAVAIDDSGVVYDNLQAHPMTWNALATRGYRGVEIQAGYGSSMWESFEGSDFNLD